MLVPVSASAKTGRVIVCIITAPNIRNCQKKEKKIVSGYEEMMLKNKFEGYTTSVAIAARVDRRFPEFEGGRNVGESGMKQKAVGAGRFLICSQSTCTGG